MSRGFVVAVEVDVESDEALDSLHAAAVGWQLITDLQTPVVKVTSERFGEVLVEQYEPGRWRRYVG